ncbi:MAG: argininosuccinate lyase [Candidatus Dormibacteria bacterium]
MARGIRVVGVGVDPQDAETALPQPAARPSARTARLAARGPAKEQPKVAKLWSGRLGGRTAPKVEKYTASLPVDCRLFADDIQGSRAHARMLREVGLLAAGEWRQLDGGLREIGRDIENDSFIFLESDEDIHSAVERGLTERIGEAAGKLHAGRSRNDQVATDLRLYCKRSCREHMGAIADLQEVLLRRAQQHRTAPLPGYTHLQRAQVISLAHHLLAFVEMLQRDVERFEETHERCDVLPLGSGALAGTTLPIDRRFTAAALGFTRISANSLDAVSDRDFCVDLVAACAQLMVHLSRLCEELVLWSSSEYGFCELPDAYATGSSLMPQKKNPDVFELARGRTSRVFGSLTALLSLSKGLPMAYNRDLQEDKVALFAAVDVTLPTLSVLSETIAQLRFDVDRMRTAAGDPALAATDIAEHLVGRGVPFREAHGVVGRAVRLAVQRRCTLAELSLEEWQGLDARVDEGVLGLFDLDAMLRRRELPGGPGPRAVARQLVRAATMVAKTRRLVTVLAKQGLAGKEVGSGARRPAE